MEVLVYEGEKGVVLLIKASRLDHDTPTQGMKYLGKMNITFPGYSGGSEETPQQKETT